MFDIQNWSQQFPSRHRILIDEKLDSNLLEKLEKTTRILKLTVWSWKQPWIDQRVEPLDRKLRAPESQMIQASGKLSIRRSHKQQNLPNHGRRAVSKTEGASNSRTMEAPRDREKEIQLEAEVSQRRFTTWGDPAIIIKPRYHCHGY